MTFKVEIASVPDRETVVGEVWWDDQMFAEAQLGHEAEVKISIYPMSDQCPWEFQLAELQLALVELERRLKLS